MVLSLPARITRPECELEPSYSDFLISTIDYVKRCRLEKFCHKFRLFQKPLLLLIDHP